MAKTPVKTKTASRKDIKKQTILRPISTDAPDADLTELLITGMRELYWAENHLMQHLPRIQEAAGDNALRKAVAGHLKVTKGHVMRLEKAFVGLGIKPQARKCDGMEGLVMEVEGIVDSTKAGSLSRLAGLIAACQKVENYESTAYKGLARLATRLGHKEITELLQATMAEEQEADNALSAIAEQQ
jgi:ferritin-like metal-binding protein YciE